MAVADAGGLRPGAVIKGREIARLQPPLTIENGRTILWLVSDDNFVPLQRTLMLKFALVE